MRILLVADIHGNWPALQALQEAHDVCLFLGDLVDYCVEPAPCIDWVRKSCRYAVRGNHDHGAAQNVTTAGMDGFKYLTGATRPLTRERAGTDGLRFLADLPVTRMANLDDLQFLLVHATPLDPLDEHAPPAADFWAPRLESIEADVVCVGHTHQPYVLEVGNKLVVNPGSLGMPWDGDSRGAYAVIENMEVELKRVEYPIEDTVRAIHDSSISEQAKDMLAEVLRSGKSLRELEKGS